MNDEGIYGFGQFATILRARYCEPKIQSVTKTDGLTFRVKEILARVFDGKNFPGRNGSVNKTVSVAADSTAAATERAEAKVSSAADHAGDTTPTMPGAEAADAAAGTNETRPDSAQSELSASREV